VHCYWAFGLGIHSEFSLLDLPVQSVRQDVLIIRQAIEDKRVEGEHRYPYLKLTAQEAIISIRGVGRLQVSNGCLIGVDPDSDAELNQLQMYLVGPAMAILLYQRNRLLLHASAVSLNGLGAAFLGDSGAGKSSIAAAFLAHGYKLVVDDIVSVELNSGYAWLDPGFPYIKLSHEAKENIAIDPEQIEFMGLVDDKASYHVSHLVNNERVRLHHIYVIQSGEDISIERFNSQQALFELIRYSIPPSMVRMNHVAHFERCVELLKHVQVYGLRRPQSLTQLSRLVEMVEENMSHLEQPVKQER
jgi:hypothetical protein